MGINSRPKEEGIIYLDFEKYNAALHQLMVSHNNEPLELCKTIEQAQKIASRQTWTKNITQTYCQNPTKHIARKSALQQDEALPELGKIR